MTFVRLAILLEVMFFKILQQHLDPLWNGHCLWADTQKHQLHLFTMHPSGFSFRKTYLFSSSRAPQSCVYNSFGTPYGLHRICEKIGDTVPMHGVFKHRHFTGVICPPSTHKSACGFITTRILRLQGLEIAKNRGYNAQKLCCDTYKRAVYMHGTNLENFIPQPLSQGCILLSNADMLDLFDATYEGDYLYITPPHE